MEPAPSAWVVVVVRAWHDPGHPVVRLLTQAVLSLCTATPRRLSAWGSL